MIPKYIEKKIDKLNTLLEQAYTIRTELSTWVEKKGGDTTSPEWYKNVVDECSAVNGICKESFYDYIENIFKN